ncbi:MULTISPECIES: hypothetical protein [unclassified Thioalkalivibrio]|uniref:hypothetical protein n=1 Tax=unclassified Thioalkalivibrio TaxID=2621013 RepID=UPI0003605BBD|nr:MULTISPECIES: hypothetical protein [unclassified Thioalkalivibrio]
MRNLLGDEREVVRSELAAAVGRAAELDWVQTLSSEQGSEAALRVRAALEGHAWTDEPKAEAKQDDAQEIEFSLPEDVDPQVRFRLVESLMKKMATDEQLHHLVKLEVEKPDGRVFEFKTSMATNELVEQLKKDGVQAKLTGSLTAEQHAFEVRKRMAM